MVVQSLQQGAGAPFERCESDDAARPVDSTDKGRLKVPERRKLRPNQHDRSSGLYCLDNLVEET
jgi:hypothetical protein